MRSSARVVLGSGVLLAALGSSPAVAEPATATPAATGDAEARSRAKVHFERGITAYKEGRFKDAIDAFLDAHKEFPSPTLSFNAARAYEKMGDSAGALRFYREYLRQSADATDKATVEARVSELEGKLQARGVQQVTVLSKPDGATVFIDERPVGVTPWTGEILPGRHNVRLRREGHDDKSQDFELKAHRAMDVSLELSKTAAQRSMPSDWTTKGETKPEPAADRTESATIGIATWATLGVGVAALGGAAVFEILRGQSEEEVKTEETQVARHEANDTMESRRTTARVLAGVGGVALLVGGVLLYLDLSADSTPAKTGFGFGCDGDGCAASLGGRFQ